MAMDDSFSWETAGTLSAVLTRLRQRRADFPSELLKNLTLRELRGKYKRSVLGWAWSIINPAVNLLVYAIVFGTFLRIEPDVGDPSGLHNYALFLMTGLLPWTFMTNSVAGAASSLTSYEALIKKVYFPRAVLPTAALLSHLTAFLIELLVLIVALMIAGNNVLPWLPVAAALIVLEFMFLLGIAGFLSVANVYFRDVQHFIGIFLNAWFYATPILYPFSLLPAWGQTVMQFNPMYHFTHAFRDVLYNLRGPTLQDWATMAGVAVLSMAFGGWFFRRHEGGLAEEL